MTARERLEAVIEEAIALLDQLDGDADDEANGDDEPSLGWTRHGALGNGLDLEEAEHAA